MNDVRRLVVFEFDEVPVSDDDLRNIARARSVLDQLRWVELVAGRVGGSLNLDTTGGAVRVERRSVAVQRSYLLREESVQAAWVYGESGARVLSQLSPFQLWLTSERVVPSGGVAPSGFPGNDEIWLIPEVGIDLVSGAAVPPGYVQLTTVPVVGLPDDLDDPTRPYISALAARVTSALKYLTVNLSPAVAGTTVQVIV